MSQHDMVEGLADYAAAGPQVAWIDDGQFAVVRMPIPLRTLPVNCYVMRGPGSGWTVLDAGMALAANELWQLALHQLHIEPHSIDQVLISHFHPDHIGGLAKLAALAADNVRVLASPLTVEQTPDMWGARMEETFRHLTAHLVRHGQPAHRVEELEAEPAMARIAVDIPPPMEPALTDGARLQLAGAAWTVVHTPGHADGHVCLYDQESRRLLSADHLLERISPAVGLWPDHSQDPLGDYLSSLGRVAELDIDIVLPGHGAPFGGHRDRCAELRRHHDERIAACLAVLDDGPASAYEVAIAVFGSHLDAANERYAITEAIAHLAHAVRRGDRVRQRVLPDGHIVFERD